MEENTKANMKVMTQGDVKSDLHVVPSRKKVDSQKFLKKRVQWKQYSNDQTPIGQYSYQETTTAILFQV